MTPSTQQAATYCRLCCQKYNENLQRILTCIFAETLQTKHVHLWNHFWFTKENQQRILTCIFAGIATSIYEITFDLINSPRIPTGLRSFGVQHKWSPIIAKFDHVWLWRLLFFLSEHHNLLNFIIPYPVLWPTQLLTKFHRWNKLSSSNQSQTNISSLLSLYLDADSFHTPTMSNRRRESHSSQPFPPSCSTTHKHLSVHI